MIKLNASVSKKVPIPGADFSSQSFGAGLEVEVADNVSVDELQEKLRDLYGLLEVSVQEQITSGSVPRPEAVKTQPKAEKEAPKSEKVEDAPATEAPAGPGKRGDATPKMLGLLKKLVEEKGESLADEERERILSERNFEKVREMIDTFLTHPDFANGDAPAKRKTEGQKPKPEIKNPDEPATEAQKRTISKLLLQKAISGEEADSALCVRTKGEASDVITKLLAVSV